MPTQYKIAVVPGDGIGHEIVPATLDVLHAALESTGNELVTTEFPFGAGHYLKHGAFMPPDGLEMLRPFDAILFGAVGLPDVDDTLPAKDYTVQGSLRFSTVRQLSALQVDTPGFLVLCVPKPISTL